MTNVSGETLNRFSMAVWELRSRYQNKERLEMNKVLSKYKTGKLGYRLVKDIVEREMPPTQDEIRRVLELRNKNINMCNKKRAEALRQLRTAEETKQEESQKQIYEENADALLLDMIKRMRLLNGSITFTIKL